MLACVQLMHATRAEIPDVDLDHSIRKRNPRTVGRPVRLPGVVARQYVPDPPSIRADDPKRPRRVSGVGASDGEREALSVRRPGRHRKRMETIVRRGDESLVAPVGVHRPDLGAAALASFDERDLSTTRRPVGTAPVLEPLPARSVDIQSRDPRDRKLPAAGGPRRIRDSCADRQYGPEMRAVGANDEKTAASAINERDLPAVRRPSRLGVGVCCRSSRTGSRRHRGRRDESEKTSPNLGHGQMVSRTSGSR